MWNNEHQNTQFTKTTHSLTCPTMSGTTTVMKSCEKMEENGTEDEEPSYKHTQKKYMHTATQHAYCSAHSQWTEITNKEELYSQTPAAEEEWTQSPVDRTEKWDSFTLCFYFFVLLLVYLSLFSSLFYLPVLPDLPENCQMLNWKLLQPVMKKKKKKHII